MRRFLPLLSLFLIKPLFAAPSISSVSGTFSGNADTASANVITITGSSFGSKSPAPPKIWATFEASTQSTAIDGDGFSASEHMERCTTSPRTGSYAACSDSTWLTDSSNKEWNVQYQFSGAGRGTKYYLNYVRRVTYTEGSGSGNWKWQRWWATEGSLPDFYVGTQGDFDQTIQVEGPGTVQYLNGTWIHPADRGQTWTKEEYRWKLNSAAGVEDGSWKVWMWDANDEDTTFSTDGASHSGIPDHLFIEDDPSNFTPGASNAYLDDVYVDDSWARVIVGSSSTYDGSRMREVCIPKTWSSTEITCYFHQGGLANGSTNYVFVCDSNDSCNATGTQIVIGGAANSAPSVSAGNDQSIELPATASLDGTVSDDGLPAGSVVSSTWTKVSGNGTVSFADDNAVDTTATFDADDTYVLQLEATDGNLTTSDTVTITVTDPPPPAGGGSGGKFTIKPADLKIRGADLKVK